MSSNYLYLFWSFLERQELKFPETTMTTADNKEFRPVGPHAGLKWTSSNDNFAFLVLGYRVTFTRKLKHGCRIRAGCEVRLGFGFPSSSLCSSFPLSYLLLEKQPQLLNATMAERERDQPLNFRSLHPTPTAAHHSPFSSRTCLAVGRKCQ